MEISSLSRNEAYSFFTKTGYYENDSGNIFIRVESDKGMYAVIDSYLPQICRVIGMNSQGLIFRYFEKNNAGKRSEKLDILITC